MQISRLHIENFRRVRELDVSFKREGTEEPRPLTLLLGANGSGKTTVLQAIALTLSLATRRTSEPGAFRWPGFIAERVSSRGPTRVELDVDLEAAEIEETRILFDLFRKAVRADVSAGVMRPGESRRVTLIYEHGTVSSPGGPEALSQLLGRFFVRTLLRSDGAQRERFANVGDVFWFDQHRNLMTIGAENALGIERLRDYLIGWWAFHTSPRRTDASDYLGLLEKRFSQLFPGTKFAGVEPRNIGGAPSTEDAYFLLERDGDLYDLAEMSSGEQAVFPLLYEFVRLDIARSVVLVDELELHLHPPEQQSLMSSLRRIGPDCQFIVTSHSPYLESMTPAEEEVRLEGGPRCL